MSDFRSLTGYAAAKIVNAELEELHLPTIPPQMVYTYINKGYIPSFVSANGKKVVSELDLAVWFNTYLEKKSALAEKKASKLAELAKQLKGDETETEVTESE